MALFALAVVVLLPMSLAWWAMSWIADTYADRRFRRMLAERKRQQDMVDAAARALAERRTEYR